jgi:hypothetical protein
MTPVIVLLVTIFFYHHPPEVRAVVAPSAEECVAAIPGVQAALEAKPEVQAARAVCLSVKGGDKI